MTLILIKLRSCLFRLWLFFLWFFTFFVVAIVGPLILRILSAPCWNPFRSWFWGWFGGWHFFFWFSRIFSLLTADSLLLTYHRIFTQTFPRISFVVDNFLIIRDKIGNFVIFGWLCKSFPRRKFSSGKRSNTCPIIFLLILLNESLLRFDLLSQISPFTWRRFKLSSTIMSIVTNRNVSIVQAVNWYGIDNRLRLAIELIFAIFWQQTIIISVIFLRLRHLCNLIVICSD